MARLDQVMARAAPTQEDKDWFEAHYPDIQTQIHKFAQGISRGNSYLADEAEQLAMIQLWLTGREKFDPERGELATYAKDVVGSLMKDIRISMDRGELSLTEFEDVDRLPWKLVYEQDWALDEGLVEYVDKLPADEYKALDMHHTGGYTQEQIATELGVSQPTVHRLIKKGTERLRKVLTEV